MDRYDKEQPGATLTYGGPELPRYEGSPFDLRISLDRMPLDEAFFVTIADPEEVTRSIDELIARYVLDPASAARLDLLDNPDLPFLRQELVQRWRAAEEGQAELRVYVNLGPDGPISLDAPAHTHLSTCVFSDGSDDYRQVDLVWRLDAPDPTGDEAATLHATYDLDFLILCLGWREELGEPALDVSADPGPAAIAALSTGDEVGLLAIGEGRVTLTGAGSRRFAELRSQRDERRRYDRYASVALDPPALGVPRGFDVRAQMLERDGVDPLPALWLAFVRRQPERAFADVWGALESLGHLGPARRALAARTGFSHEALARLAAIPER